MNKKGQAGVGMILMVGIALIIGVVFFQSIAQEAGESTNTETITNVSINSGAAVDNVSTYYVDYRSIADVSITNGTALGAGAAIASANYTTVNNVIDPDDGTLSVSITPLTTIDWDVQTGNIWMISGTAQPTTYIAESGARSIVGLIAIFFALAVAVIALAPTMKSGILEMMGR